MTSFKDQVFLILQTFENIKVCSLTCDVSARPEILISNINNTNLTLQINPELIDTDSTSWQGFFFYSEILLAMLVQANLKQTDVKQLNKEIGELTNWQEFNCEYNRTT